MKSATPAIMDSVLDDGVTNATFFDEVVESWLRHGLVGQDLFDALARERPNRAADVDVEARLFGCLVSPMGSKGNTVSETASGWLMTVRGSRPATEIGTALMHEHLWIRTRPKQGYTMGGPVTDMFLDASASSDVRLAVERFRHAGGRTILDATPAGCERNPLFLRDVAGDFDVNILCCTGWYTRDMYPQGVEDLAVVGRADAMIRELAVGIGDTGIRAGFIKVGCSHGFPDQERLTLAAAAIAQRETGCSLHVHLPNMSFAGGRWRLLPPEERHAYEIIQNLRREEVDLGRVVLCHADGTYFRLGHDIDYHMRLLDSGVTLSYDQFGAKPGPQQLSDVAPTHDRQRAQGLVRLFGSGYGGQLVVSHDVSQRNHLIHAGGDAYAYLLTDGKDLLLAEGVSEGQYEQLTVDNPRSLLSLDRLPQYEHGRPTAKWSRSAWFWHAWRPKDGIDDDETYFSVDEVPLLQHPEVAGLPGYQRELILAHTLVNFLEFTVWLEMNPVQEACRRIRDRNAFKGIKFEDGIRAAALSINVDEALHADMCNDLIQEVTRKTGIRPIGLEPACSAALRAIKAEAPSSIEEYLDLMFVIVSETTLTGFLDRTPSDLSVARRVRDVLRDHAEDERGHSVFFARLFSRVWRDLSDERRELVGVRLPLLLDAFLLPDLPLLIHMLESLGVDGAGRIARETLELDGTRRLIIEAATPTIRVLENGGVMEVPSIRNAFLGSRYAKLVAAN